MMVMPVMHEYVHQGARQEDQEGQPAEEVCAVFCEQIEQRPGAKHPHRPSRHALYALTCN
jgi:hypothetical protein